MNDPVAWKYQAFNTWDFFTLDEHNNYRLYYKKETECVGFTVYGVCFVSMAVEDTMWDKNSSMEVNMLFEAHALFDGMRHLWPNPYWYYIPAEVIARYFDLIRALECQWCSDPPTEKIYSIPEILLQKAGEV